MPLYMSDHYGPVTLGQHEAHLVNLADNVGSLSVSAARNLIEAMSRHIVSEAALRTMVLEQPKPAFFWLGAEADNG